ncbi:MAG: hypothetical protein JWL81_3497 [Verrucomicrobiales bacterium]|nr:hypothetical protein [Verrucomicrobiales bacterium]
MVAEWARLNPKARILVAYGGREEVLAEVAWDEKVFISDPRLRTRDHQRERQSYLGIMRAVTAHAEAKGWAGGPVILAECDVVPLRAGLADYLAERAATEGADVLGARLRRVDGTGHPHVLAHEFHPRFQEWLAGSIREDKSVVLMMLGCLTWWSWEAFKAISETAEPMPVYLELAMPTAAHQLGFRVRGLPEWEADMEPLGELEQELEARRQAGRWVLHPCKKIWRQVGGV